jgi:SAM-dependent methyltransferase
MPYENVSVYRKQWDQFYSELARGNKGKALWDVDPDLAVALDYARFSAYLNKNLPILDFGCGTGQQTVWLGSHYLRGIGIDVSQNAVELANQYHTIDNVDFRLADQTDPKFNANLRAEYGDMNVYVRGVLHQIMTEHQSGIVDSLKILMGEKGRLYLIEVADNIREYLSDESAAFASLPAPMRRTLISRLPPQGLSIKELTRLFPKKDFNIITNGSSQLNTNIKFINGNSIQIPAVYCIVETV